MTKPNLFLIPGWAVNSSVWNSVEAQLEMHFTLHRYDFPGYGSRQQLGGSLTLDELAQDALAHAPENALWLAWSLGSMVAVQAALCDGARMAQLMLVCPTAKFAADDTWEHGQSRAAIDNLADRFEHDYQMALKRFLLLQAGTSVRARALAKETLSKIMQCSPPSWPTLESGLAILRQTDLRSELKHISVSTSVIVAQQDRVIPAAAGIDLHQKINGSKLIELNTGHAPFLEQPDLFARAVKG